MKPTESLNQISKLPLKEQQKIISTIDWLNPAVYLYKTLLSFKDKENLSIEFLELCYITLSSWGMNKRQAKLRSFNEFTAEISKFKDQLNSLALHHIDEIHKNAELHQVLNDLFVGINITQTKSKIVSTSKLLHFLLPNLIVPIDRQFTLKFFNITLNDKNEAMTFMDLQNCFSKFANDNSYLSQLTNDNNSFNIPKVIDNLIIGTTKNKVDA